MKTNQSNSLKELIEKKRKLMSSLSHSARNIAEDRFKDVGGCEQCRGRGWVVTWDTLDSMSGCYHESEACSSDGCTSEKREISGLLPQNTKYDRLHTNSVWIPKYTDEETAFLRKTETEIAQLERDVSEEESAWSPTAGKIVRVVKKSAGPESRRTPLGIEGIVIKSFHNEWGTHKLIVMDRNGKRWWPGAKKVEVIDPEPDMKSWESLEEKELKETGLPVIAFIQRKSSKAALIKLTDGKEMWVPISQCPQLKSSRSGQTVAFNLPMWFAKSKGLCS